MTKVTVADDLANLDQAKNAATEADVVVLMAGLVATEGADQPDANGANARVTVTASVANTGAVAGAEVVQVYVGIPVQGQPPKRLVGFQKVYVEPGESKPVTITIDPTATNHPFSVWDYCTQSFVIKPGQYTIYIGNSADNTPHTAMLTAGGQKQRREPTRARGPRSFPLARSLVEETHDAGHELYSAAASGFLCASTGTLLT